MEKTQEAQSDGDKTDRQIDTLVDLESRFDKLAEEAEKEILNELGLSPLEIEKLSQEEDIKKD